MYVSAHTAFICFHPINLEELEDQPYGITVTPVAKSAMLPPTLLDVSSLFTFLHLKS